MNWLQRAYSYLLLAPALIPLVVCGGLYYPYLFPKVMLFYALTLLSLAAFAFLSSGGELFYFTRLKSRITWVPALLLFLAYMTSIPGLDLYKSFWSIFGRGDGLLMLTLSVASFYLMLLSADQTFFRRFTRTVATVGTLIAVWGVGEWFFTGGRISSSIGNPAFLAGYLALSFFVTLLVARQLSHTLRRLAVFGAVLQLIAILLTATRGTLLAFMVIAIGGLLYLVAKGEGSARRWSIMGLVGFFVCVTGFFFLRETLVESSFTPVARVAQISISDSNIANRLFVWTHMVDEIKKRPLTGYGAEHIAFLFDRFYDPGVITEEWFDRSHNTYLDYAAQFGIGGLLLYLALICSLVVTALQQWKRDKGAGVLIVGAALVYAVQNFFVFDTISSWWLFLALFAVCVAQQEDSPKTAISTFRVPHIGAGIAVALVLLIVPVTVLPTLSNYNLSRGYYYHIIDVTRANTYFEKGLALKTYGDLEYGYQLHTMYTEQQALRLSGLERISAYNMARDVLTENYKRFPYDARTAMYLTHVLDSAPPETPADSTFVREVAVHTVELSPKRAQTWYVLANLSIESAKTLPVGSHKTARYQEAIIILETYVSIVPSLSEPYFVLADLYFATGDVTRANATASLGDARYRKGLSTARRAALLYEKLQDWEKAAVYLERVVEQDATDTIFYYDLAKVKFVLGAYNEAVEIVRELRIRAPEILISDKAFLDAIAPYERNI